MKPDIKGLTKLARAIQHVPKKNFNIHDWLSKEPSCGTVGCIAGWAALTFPHRFRKDITYKDDNGLIEYDVVHRQSGEIGSSGFAKAFKITQEDAEELTLNNFSCKRTPQAAAKAVMALVGRLKKSLKK